MIINVVKARKMTKHNALIFTFFAVDLKKLSKKQNEGEKKNDMVVPKIVCNPRGQIIYWVGTY